MKLLKTFIFNTLFLFLFVVGVSASGKYITDDAGVLKPNTISTIEQNLTKIEKNTEVTVKFDIVKSLNGKSIDDYANQYVKSNISGDQYILFVVSTGDRKNKLLVGNKVNNILSQSDISNIVSLPNSDFKNNNFDSGMIKVGKALDEKITTKAVNVGKAEVNSDGYSTTVQHKTNWLKVFGIILLITLVLVGIGIFIKRKVDMEYDKRKKNFAEENNLNDYIETNNTFHSANVSKKKSTNTYNNEYKKSSNTSDCSSNYEIINRRYNNSGSYTPHHSYSSGTHTTVINNGNNNGFVEGMILGEILTESHEHHHYNEPAYKEPEKHQESSSSYSSNDWSNSSSSWDSGSSSSSSWDSSSSSSDYSSSSWDSSSDYSSSDW